jgi:hypothetical protein
MRVMVLLFAGLTLACTDAGGNVQGPPPTEAALPANAVILDAGAVPAMLRQCSRAAPAAGEGSWRPGPADIAALEAALPAGLAAQNRPGVDWSRAPEGWLRQYVGLLRGGRRFIYGNFVPASLGGDDPAGRWRDAPAIICDGGPAFFGVEYDVEARRFTHFAFNGSV